VNLLSGATGNGVSYTSLSAAQDINGNLFTQQGQNATSTGLGLQGLSTTMKGATVALGSASFVAADSGTTATASVISMKNISAANNAGTAANPAISTSFVMDDQNTNGLASTTTLSNLLGTAISTALGTTGAKVTVGSNGALTSSDITSSSTSSDGSTVYQLTNGKTITASSDASGNTTYDVSTAVDANGNSTAVTHIVDVNTSDSAAQTDASQKRTSETSSLMTAMGNAGFGTSLANDGTLTVAGGNLSVSSISFANTQTASPSIRLPQI